MMPKVDIEDATSTRLQAIATPLVDTYDTVIVRLLDHWEASKSAQAKMLKPGEPIKTLDDGVTMHFDPANPPSLSFTTCLEIVVGGQKLPKGDTYWNSLMNAMIREIHQRGHDAKAIQTELFVNAEVGKKEENGYKFLSDVGLSVQGQDSNAAFRQAYQLAVQHGVKFQVWFVWQNNEKAAHANRKAVLEF